MKKGWLVVLLLALLLSFPSCKNRGETGDAPTATATSEQETPPTEEEQVKKKALDLMQTSQTQKSPTELFAHFAGDFQITGFTASQDGIRSVKRKNAVTLVDAGELCYYGVEAAGYLFYAADYNQSAEISACFPLSADASDSSTVFTAFGIDTSALYTGTDAADEEDGAETLTSDMLTVSDDKTECEFSKVYIDTLAKALCREMGFPDALTTSFLKNYTGSGVYSAAKNQVTFDIRVKDTQLGSVHQTVKFATDQAGKWYTYSYLEYSNASAGIPTPIVVEIECKDVVYRDTVPVSATIKLKRSSARSFRDGSVTVKLADNIETTFTLDCTDLASRFAVAVCKKKETETAMGESWTRNSTFSVSLDLGKPTAQFQFTEKQDGETSNFVKANRVTFASSPSIVTPKRVVDRITSYINDHFGGVEYQEINGTDR